MPNRDALIIHYLACFKAGFVATPLNYRYMPPEIDHALEVSEATVMLAHAERDQDLAASRLAPRLPLGVIGTAPATATERASRSWYSARRGSRICRHHLRSIRPSSFSRRAAPASPRASRTPSRRWVRCWRRGARAQKPPRTTSFCPAARPRTSAPFCSRSRRFRPARVLVPRTFDGGEPCRCCASTARRYS